MTARRAELRRPGEPWQQPEPRCSGSAYTAHAATACSSLEPGTASRQGATARAWGWKGKGPRPPRLALPGGPLLLPPSAAIRIPKLWGEGGIEVSKQDSAPPRPSTYLPSPTPQDAKLGVSDHRPLTQSLSRRID